MMTNAIAYTAEEESRKAKKRQRDAEKILSEAKEAGVDIDSLRYNLSLTPEQRLKKFLKALAWHEFAKISKKKHSTKEKM